MLFSKLLLLKPVAQAHVGKQIVYKLHSQHDKHLCHRKLEETPLREQPTIYCSIKHV